MRRSQGCREQWSLGNWTIEIWDIREAVVQALCFAKDLLIDEVKIKSNTEKSTVKQIPYKQRS